MPISLMSLRTGAASALIPAALLCAGCSGEPGELVPDASEALPSTEPPPLRDPGTPGLEVPPGDDADDTDDEDGALDPDAGGAGPIMKGTFEAASAACNEWLPTDADAIRSVPPHGGSFACRICSVGQGADMALSRVLGPVEAGTYVLSGWLGRRRDKPGPDRATASVSAVTSEGVLHAEATVPLDRGYTFVAVPFTLPSAASAIEVSFHAPADEGTCLLVDDVFIVRHREGL